MLSSFFTFSQHLKLISYHSYFQEGGIPACPRSCFCFISHLLRKKSPIGVGHYYNKKRRLGGLRHQQTASGAACHLGRMRFAPTKNTGIRASYQFLFSMSEFIPTLLFMVGAFLRVRPFFLSFVAAGFRLRFCIIYIFSQHLKLISYHSYFQEGGIPACPRSCFCFIVHLLRKKTIGVGHYYNKKRRLGGLRHQQTASGATCHLGRMRFAPTKNAG